MGEPPLRWRHPHAGWALGLLAAAVGATAASAPLSDNSFLTHLATGRLILETGSVPSADPYSWTAAGSDWVVQSWLVSWIYGVLDEVVGLSGIRLFHGALGAVLGATVWWLARAQSSLVVRLAVCVPALVVGALFWVERPLLVGLVAFVAVIAALDGALPRWVVLPVMWVWVSSHGSFPFALLLVAATWVGARLDGERGRHEAGTGAWVLGGIALGGVLSPVGPELITFPLGALERSEALQAVSEWRSPDFTQWGPRAFLLQLVLSLLVARRSVPWRRLVPAAVFVAAALAAVRNVPHASLLLVPVTAAAPALGSLRWDDRDGLARILAPLAGVGFALAMLFAVVRPDTALEQYPRSAIDELERRAVLPSGSLRLAHPDLVGNYLVARYGTDQPVFFDDRYDLYSVDLLEDMIDLRRGRDVIELLDAYEVELVLWEEESALAETLRAAPGWVRMELPEDDGWALFQRSEG